MEKSGKSLPFSEDAIQELAQVYDSVVELFDISVEGLAAWDKSRLDRVWEYEDWIDNAKDTLRSNHIVRLNKGTCFPGSGIVFIEVINNLERMADHCINIAEAVLSHKGPPTSDEENDHDHIAISDWFGRAD